MHPKHLSGSLQWMNVHPSSFNDDPLEVIKLFVLRIQGNQMYSQLSDFDHASLLMIMGKFKPFHNGDRNVVENVQKVG